MIRRYKGDNWTIKETPSTVCIKERLSNGQYLCMWFWRKRFNDPHKQITYMWTVGLYIGDKKGAAHWRSKKTRVKQTGKCGLEGLKVALDYIKTFTSHLGYKEELQISHEDMKRHRAYKFLLRYPGFTEYVFDSGEKPCVAFRTPDHWEWIPNKK